MTVPGIIVENSYTCSCVDRCRKNELSSDYHCWHQQGAKHLLKDLDFWDILDINLQNGPCLERCLAFCQCQLFMLNQHSTNSRLTWRTLTPFAIVEVLQPQEHCTFCCSPPCDNS